MKTEKAIHNFYENIQSTSHNFFQNILLTQESTPHNLCQNILLTKQSANQSNITIKTSTTSKESPKMSKKRF